MATGQKTHTEVPPKGHFPPFQKEHFASQLFWLAVSFVALYLIISKLAIPRIGGIFAARTGRVSDDVAEAKRLKNESDAAIANYEKALADARARAQILANETREKYAAEAAAARKALDATLDARIAEAETIIATRRTAAMANVEGIAVEAASAIVERLIGKIPAGPDVANAVTEALKH
jgi:F-type H+-transporting ATPase subunit b